MKWLLLAAVVGAVLWFLGRGRRVPGPGQGQPPSNRSGAGSEPGEASTAAEPEPMVACAHCGLLVPRSDALAAPSKAALSGPLLHYCCEEHRRAGPRLP
ncbi:MAG: hypothetical protein FJY26_08380 [Betaproteobacteria bacterium]|nr:hypothetical protein [Betaproteobacteria bacterium]